MSHTNSRRWESEAFKQSKAFNQKFAARKSVVQNYEFLDFLPQCHKAEKILKEEMRVAKDGRKKRKLLHEQQVSQNGWNITLPAFTKPHARQLYEREKQMHEKGRVGEPFEPFEGKCPFQMLIKPAPEHRIFERHWDSLDSFPPVFGAVEIYGRTSVLAQESIWLPSTNRTIQKDKRMFVSNTGIWAMMNGQLEETTYGWPEDCAESFVQANWPCAEELKFEGPDRAKHHEGRFMPLPRKPPPVGNGTVGWRQLTPVKQNEFDETFCGSVHKKITAEDAAFMEFEVGFEDIETFGRHVLGVSLMAELHPEGIYCAQRDFDLPEDGTTHRSS